MGRPQAAAAPGPTLVVMRPGRQTGSARELGEGIGVTL
jgi:hypothetical protein